jgi:hypothetical protein
MPIGFYWEGKDQIENLRQAILNSDEFAAIYQKIDRVSSDKLKIRDLAFAKLELFWQACDIVIDQDKSPIFVDLMHGSIEYIYRSLVIAKYTQINKGAPIIGLIGSPGVVTTSYAIDYDFNKKFAASFGIT